MSTPVGQEREDGSVPAAATQDPRGHEEAAVKPKARRKFESGPRHRHQHVAPPKLAGPEVAGL